MGRRGLAVTAWPNASRPCAHPQAPRGLGTAQDSSCPPKSSPCPGPAGTRSQNSVQSNAWHQTTPGLLATRR